MLRLCSCFLLALVWANSVIAAEFTGKVRVIDGDTLDVGGIRLRLHGIDAPERDQPCTTLSGQDWGCGDWVTQQVRDRYQGAQARCEATDHDRYKRVVARCFVDGLDIGQDLVATGLAYAYRKYTMEYDLEEKAAFIADRGIHGFTLSSPERYRLTRTRGREAPDSKCLIKGNINGTGAHIYHVPGQKFYERTGIRSEAGERWFCSEAQARASGWRAARQ
ncbi:thermonuclease family protein [Sulfitobacter sp. F26204]|uniref:thermonuclease family protein n=1 Tax=Sulfitobacter sp. F26204 TaxID=2996014 RepID=UPI00225E0A15|nr:thermonuclease family protein [Sulfitobacter sp. F26204]MCX7559107.1 thermonuclease family protein [Sulfitobacter sp. F26204]